MKLIAAGVGPGDPGLVTFKALEAVKSADLVVVPLSAAGRASVAEQIVTAHAADLPILRMVFPMTGDASARDTRIREQLAAHRDRWQNAEAVAMPVLGDAALYATTAYLFDIWRELEPSLTLEIVPGVSAHSLISAKAGKFLALGEEILSIVPGTAPEAQIREALHASDSAALFKPSALKDRLRDVVNGAGPWGKIVRIDRAGMPEERVYEGDAALDAPDEYLSTMLLWRK